VCQGKTWHRMLRTGGFPWARAFRAGTVRWERKWEQARDLLRGGVLRGKVAKTSLQATCRFPGSWEEVRRVYGVAQERAITVESVEKGNFEKEFYWRPLLFHLFGEGGDFLVPKVFSAYLIVPMHHCRGHLSPPCPLMRMHASPRSGGSCLCCEPCSRASIECLP
jgi:hypothetical protein